MSEFKFACPVCGQHITADSAATGSQLDCPTCFRKIIVPQAPSSAESKFVLSASEANKPRPISNNPPVSKSSDRNSAKRSSVPLMSFALAFSILAGGISLYFFRGKPFDKGQKTSDQIETSSVKSKAEAPLPRRFPTGTNVWMLDLTNAQFPGETAFGNIRGADFVCDRTIIQGGALNLRMGREWPPELGLTIFLYAKQAEDLSGKSALVTTNNIRSPRVVLRWKGGTENKTETYTNGFALKLEFGPQKGNRLPGKIYLCLPDEAQSCVAGAFNAEIRKATPPKPKPSQ